MQKNSVIVTIVSLVILAGLAFAYLTSAPQTAETSAPTTETAATADGTETPADTQTAVTESAPADAAATDLSAAPQSLQLDVPKMMQDRVLGNADAPVTITEFASLTCPHCAKFNEEILPEVKKQLIETGKAKLVFREFPLNAPAVKASMMARCAPEDKYYDLLEVLFKNQDRWMGAEDVETALTQYGTLAGMDAAFIKTCMSSEELETAIVAKMQEAQSKYDIKATPSFILNDGAKKIFGSATPQEFIDAVTSFSARN